jgi:hypothetical protein
MSTFIKKLKNPKTGKKQVAVCHDDHFAHHIYGYGFKKDGSDFKMMEDFREMRENCDFYRREELIE